jgi:hypothetical protein
MPRIRTALALGIALAACGGGEEQGAAPFATGTVCPPGGTALRWADLDLEFFGSADGQTGYCNYCHHSTRVTNADRHGAPPDVRLDLLADVRAAAARIDAAAGKGPTATSPSMPFVIAPEPGVPDPQPIPLDAERISLSVWLACGAPD